MRASLIALAILVAAFLGWAPAHACPEARIAEASAPDAGVKFDWAVDGTIVIECWTVTNVIAIAARDGATLRAAQAGTVVYAGALERYGTVVLIRHANGLVSAVYGDIGDLAVKRHDQIEKGQPIGIVRAARDFAGTGIRFELRQGANAVDPRPFMSTPEPKRATGAASPATGAAAASDFAAP